MQDHQRWVLVTGGSRGIGRSLVEHLASTGYKVVFTYVNSGAVADQLVTWAHEHSLHVEGYRCDGGIKTEVEGLVNRLIAKHGAPHSLINNAGITADTLLYNMDEDAWDSVIRNNLKSCYLFSKYVLPAMFEARNGAILNMSSITAIKGNPGQFNYAATKSAMLGMTRTLALEVARFNVRVNSILPGLVETEMLSRVPEQELKGLKRAVPLRRLCSVQEVSKLAGYLISDDAAYITGQAISIDGGMTA